jgi:hypothetical protein
LDGESSPRPDTAARARRDGRCTRNARLPASFPPENDATCRWTLRSIARTTIMYSGVLIRTHFCVHRLDSPDLSFQSGAQANQTSPLPNRSSAMLPSDRFSSSSRGTRRNVAFQCKKDREPVRLMLTRHWFDRSATCSSRTQQTPNSRQETPRLFVFNTDTVTALPKVFLWHGCEQQIGHRSSNCRRRLRFS